MSCADPVRKDRPHTFLLHAPTTCPVCALPGEGRVVVRGKAVVSLLLCPACGPTEQPISNDADAWMLSFLDRGVVPPGFEGDHLFKHTTSTCPECLSLVKTDVVIRGDGCVYFKKQCVTCGPSEALVSEDARYYVRAYAFARAGTEPLRFAAEVKHGCPTDCGTCSDHEQHTCLPIIEVTDHCNLECPICIVDNQYSTHMAPEAFSRIIDTLITNEGQVESIAISGGEPTSHPRILDLVRIADRPEIGRVVVITNGLRLGRDRAFAQALKDAGAYVGLQLDGFTAEAHTLLRGRDLCPDKEAALRMLEALDIPTQLIFVAARGVNEDQIGRAVELFLAKDHILSLNFQPAAFTGQGGGRFAHDPMDRLTIPGVIRRIEEQTHGSLRFSDFFPLPCSHPQCVSLTYLMRMDDGSHLPFARFVDFERFGGLLRSSATLPATREMEEILADLVYDVFSRQDEIDRADEVLAALKRSVGVMFPDRVMTPKEGIRIGERQAKSIFLHHYMDRHDFDLERLRKCCHHYPQTDGRIMPACGFNMFHRGAAKGTGTTLEPLVASAASDARSRLRIVPA